jgi:SAM-dependent methyltransferase
MKRVLDGAASGAKRLASMVPGGRRALRSRRLRAALGFEETIWTRKVSDEQVRQLVAALDPARLSALEISGNVWRTYGFRSHRRTSFPEFDICSEALPEQFDLVIAEHIFEHLLWPYRAGRNVLRMLKPNGYFLIVTPFMYRVHPNPVDCTRWTETGLRYFLAECGFPLEPIVTGSWGNRECIKATWRREFRLFNRHVHSLAAEPEYPIVVWALARASSDEAESRAR